jgi:DnaK suppressor protein
LRLRAFRTNHPSPRKDGPVAESTLTKEQLAHLRAKLEAKRNELRQKSRAHVQAATHHEEALVEQGDLATELSEMNETLGLADHEQALLVEVEGALEKFGQGTYGLSEESGEPIPYARLDAVPWARKDAHEAELEERARR